MMYWQNIGKSWLEETKFKKNLGHNLQENLGTDFFMW